MTVRFRDKDENLESRKSATSLVILNKTTKLISLAVRDRSKKPVLVGNLTVAQFKDLRRQMNELEV